MKVYIIDDAPIILSIIGFMLNKQRIDCKYSSEVTVSTYDEILEYDPDVIILDLHLKNAEGIAVAQLIHAIPELKNTPIIAISHTKTLFKKVMLESNDFADFVEKPIKNEELLSLIKTYGTLGSIFNTGKQLLRNH